MVKTWFVVNSHPGNLLPLLGFGFQNRISAYVEPMLLSQSKRRWEIPLGVWSGVWSGRLEVQKPRVAAQKVVRFLVTLLLQFFCWILEFQLPRRHVDAELTARGDAVQIVLCLCFTLLA